MSRKKQSDDQAVSENTSIVPFGDVKEGGEGDNEPASGVLDGELAAPDSGEEPARKNWGPPYKAIVVNKEAGFELGEDRRYKQRVFKFAEKPAGEILQRLREAGFVYRGGEKAWTIPANAYTRQISDDLASEFAGQGRTSERSR